MYICIQLYILFGLNKYYCNKYWQKALLFISSSLFEMEKQCTVCAEYDNTDEKWWQWWQQCQMNACWRQHTAASITKYAKCNQTIGKQMIKNNNIFFTERRTNHTLSSICRLRIFFIVFEQPIIFFLQIQLQWTNWLRNFNGKIANFFFFLVCSMKLLDIAAAKLSMELWLIDFLVVSSWWSKKYQEPW